MTTETQAPAPTDRLAEIQARANAATPGPWCTDSWEIYQGTEYQPGISFWIGETCRGATSPEQDRADATFVAAAREDVPWLVAHAADLAARLVSAEAQLRAVDERYGPVLAAVDEWWSEDLDADVAMGRIRDALYPRPTERRRTETTA